MERCTFALESRVTPRSSGFSSSSYRSCLPAWRDTGSGDEAASPEGTWLCISLFPSPLLMRYGPSSARSASRKPTVDHQRHSTRVARSKLWLQYHTSSSESQELHGHNFGRYTYRLSPIAYSHAAVIGMFRSTRTHKSFGSKTKNRVVGSYTVEYIDAQNKPDRFDVSSIHIYDLVLGISRHLLSHHRHSASLSCSWSHSVSEPF